MSFVASAFIVTWIALILLAFALSGVIRQVRHLSQHDLPTRRAALDGPRRQLRMPGVDVPLLLLLVDGSCQVCKERFDDLRRQSDRHRAERVAFAVASRDGPAPGGDRAANLMIYDHADEIFEAVAPRVLPYGLVLDASGEVVDSTAVGSARQLEQLTAVALRHAKAVETP